MPLLVISPTPKELHNLGTLSLDGSECDEGALANEAHNKGLECLTYFAEKVGVSMLRMRGIFKVGDGGVEQQVDLMPAAKAMLYMSVACTVRDISRIASILQEEFLSSHCEGKSLDHDSVLGYFVFLQRQLQRALSDAKAEINDRMAVEMEVDGWRLPLSLGLVREWVRAMSLLCGKVEKTLVSAMVAVLDVVVDKCRRAIPSWEAVLDTEHLDEGILKQMMGAKQGVFVAGHNEVHEIMERMNAAAMLLDIRPELQHNDLAKQSVAVGMNTLARTTTACIVSAGISMVDRYRSDPDGPNKAKKFVITYKEKHPAIPEQFWQVFEDIASYSAPAPASQDPLPLGTSTAPAEQQPNKAVAKESPDEEDGGSTAEGSSSTARDAKRAGAALAVRVAGGAVALKRRRR